MNKDNKKPSVICELLRLVRIAQDFSTKDIAMRIGCRTSYITDVERGDRTPTLKTLEKYRRALEIPTSMLFELKETQEKEHLSYRKILIKILLILEEKNCG